jgi:drug/metabolite transporter (DMT)-like permease
MEGTLALGIGLAILASTNINVGKGIQKWKVHIWGKKGAMFNQENLPDTLIWFVGLALTASAVVILPLALKYTDRTSMVSSFNGVGMIGLVIFAWLVLHEKIGWRELGGAALILIGTAIMKYFDVPVAQKSFSLARFLASFGAIFGGFGLLALYSWKTNRFYGFAVGSLPGILIGSAMILADMGLVKTGNSIMGLVTNPLAIFGFICGVMATVFTQFAFWRAKAMVVVPTINSFIILAPVVIEYFTFGQSLKAVQYAAVAVIIAGVILLTATEKADRIEGVKKA